MLTGTQHVFDLMDISFGEKEIPGTVVLFGDDGFLVDLAKRQILAALQGPDSDELPPRTFNGKDVQWRDVNDELSTASLFAMGHAQAIVITDAAAFISAYRPQLEDWAHDPGSTSTLILITDTWLATTKLYKSVEKQGLQIACGLPIASAGRSKSVDMPRILKWLTAWCKTRHQLKLPGDAANYLFELSHSNFGMIDNSLAKLSLLFAPGSTITIDAIQEHVGGWKTQSVWTAVDHALEGAADRALASLHPIFHSGEHPLSVMGQLSWTLRRYAVAYDHYNAARRQALHRAQENRPAQKVDIADSLKAAGFRTWQGEMDKAAARIRRLGRRRLDVVHRWLLDVDLALKGTHSREDLGRQLLERLMISLAQANA